jgi:hypothetical protein
VTVLDPVEDHGARRIEQNFILIGVKLPHREAASRGKAAQRVGNPGGQARHIVEGEHMTVARGDEEIAILARQRPQRRGIWVEQRPKDRREGRFH